MSPQFESSSLYFVSVELQLHNIAVSHANILHIFYIIMYFHIFIY